MPATPASPMFYASAQGDRIPSPGRLDPDYPPFPNHGWAVFAGRMPTNGSSWHAGWPDPMGKGATPRWMSAGWGECLRGHWPQGAPPHLCIVGPDGACCVASQYGQLRPGRGRRAPRAMLPRPQLTLEYQIPVVLPELARAGDEPWPSLDGHGSRSGMARLPRRVTATSGSDPKVPGGDVPPIVHVAGLPAEQGGRRAAGRGNPGKGSRGQLESYRSACRDAKAAVGKRDRRPPGGGAWPGAQADPGEEIGHLTGGSHRHRTRPRPRGPSRISENYSGGCLAEARLSTASWRDGCRERSGRPAPPPGGASQRRCSRRTGQGGLAWRGTAGRSPSTESLEGPS